MIFRTIFLATLNYVLSFRSLVLAFYEDLAVPKQLVEFNSDYQKDVSQHIDLIREIINKMDSDFIPISHYEVIITAAITKLNNKKYGDELGISAEHFKLAGQSIVAVLVELFNAILEHDYIPPQFLSGIITPVYKKGRDATDFSNYRGITVSCTIGTILEHVRGYGFFLKKYSDSQ